MLLYKIQFRIHQSPMSGRQHGVRKGSTEKGLDDGLVGCRTTGNETNHERNLRFDNEFAEEAVLHHSPLCFAGRFELVAPSDIDR